MLRRLAAESRVLSVQVEFRFLGKTAQALPDNQTEHRIQHRHPNKSLRLREDRLPPEARLSDFYREPVE